MRIPTFSLRAILTFFFFLSLSILTYAQQRIQGYVEQGGFQYSGSTSARVQRSYPNATVTVYLTGTTTLATIYSNLALTTPKSNPFTADNMGYYFFYASSGIYDIEFSGSGITSPFTSYNVATNLIIPVATTTTAGIAKASYAPSNPSDPIFTSLTDPRLHYLGIYTKAAMNALTARNGDFVKISDAEGGFFYNNGSAWIKLNPYIELSDFGMKCDGTTNNEPFLTNAINFVKTNTLTSAKLVFPVGVCKFTTPKVYDLAGTHLVFVGHSSRTKIFVALTNSQNLWSFTNAEGFDIRDLAFVGNAAIAEDCRNVLSFTDCQKVSIANVDFYGLAALQAGASMIGAASTDLFLTNVNFYGCTTSSGTSGPIIVVDSFIGLHVDGVNFKDFGALDGVFYSKTGFGPAYALVLVVTPKGTTYNYTGQQTIDIRNVRFDEGLLSVIRIDSNPGVSGKWVDDVRLYNISGNVGNISNSAIVASGVRRLFIDSSHFGYSTVGGNILLFSDCEYVVVSNSGYTENAGCIFYTSNAIIAPTLELRDSTFQFLRTDNGLHLNYYKRGHFYLDKGIPLATNVSYATIDGYLAYEMGVYGDLFVALNIISSGNFFSGIGTPPNGYMIWCIDCNEADPCAGGGNGAWAKRQNGRWKCN